MTTLDYNIYFYIRKDRPNNEDKYPIYIRVSLSQDKFTLPTGQSVAENNWDDKRQKAVKTKDAATINSILNIKRDEINQAINQLYISKTELTVENVRCILNGEPIVKEKYFIATAQEHNDNFEKQVGKKYSYGSFKNYKTTLKYLIEFIPKHYHKKDIPLKWVNYKFCEAYFQKENIHRFTALHIPTTNNIKTFCEQILSLVILTIDSLNEKELGHGIILEKGDKGISKLEKYLLSNGIKMPDMISFLRNLQDLRSGLLAHRFSKSATNSKRAIQYFGINEGNYITVAKDIFIKSINTMNTMEKVFKLVDK